MAWVLQGQVRVEWTLLAFEMVTELQQRCIYIYRSYVYDIYIYIEISYFYVDIGIIIYIYTKQI